MAVATVIVTPPHLSFHSSEPEQKFEIFNLHQYPVKFVVKATAPEKYIITNTEGMIKPQCKVTIHVIHNDINVANEEIRDKFRIILSLFRHKKLEPIGYKDITAVLYSQKKTSVSSSGGDFGAHRRESSSPSRRIPHTASSSPSRAPMAQAPPTPSEALPPANVSPGLGSHKSEAWIGQCHNLLAYLLPIGVGLAAIMFIPTKGTVPDTPWYWELSEGSKQTISFFLGVVVTLFYWRVQQTER